jgi:hypothetical protein
MERTKIRVGGKEVDLMRRFGARKLVRAINALAEMERHTGNPVPDAFLNVAKLLVARKRAYRRNGILIARGR